MKNMLDSKFKKGLGVRANAKLDNLRKQRQDKGASLLEVIIYMGIAAFIIIVVMQGGNQATDTQKVNAAIQNLNTLKTSIQQMFSTQRTYEGIGNAVLTASSNFPEQMRVPTDDSLIAHGWKSDGVDVIAANVAGTDNDGYEIVFKGVPQRACVDILDRTYRHFAEVEANNTDVTTGIAAIRTNCVDGDNDLTFRDR
jgi:type II secretory pathway pseudopilin PulG